MIRQPVRQQSDH